MYGYQNPADAASQLADEIAFRVRRLAHATLMLSHALAPEREPEPSNVVSLPIERAKRRASGVEAPAAPPATPDPRGCRVHLLVRVPDDFPPVMAMARGPFGDWRDEWRACYRPGVWCDLGCDIDGIVYAKQWRKGTLYVPDGDCGPDMSACIALFEHIDSRVKRIEVFAGDVIDGWYVKTEGRWHSYSAEYDDGFCMCCY